MRSSRDVCSLQPGVQQGCGLLDDTDGSGETDEHLQESGAHEREEDSSEVDLTDDSHDILGASSPLGHREVGENQADEADTVPDPIFHTGQTVLVLWEGTRAQLTGRSSIPSARCGTLRAAVLARRSERKVG